MDKSFVNEIIAIFSLFEDYIAWIRVLLMKLT